MKRLCLVVLSVLLFASCAYVPPREAQTVDFLQFISDWTRNFTAINARIWADDVDALVEKNKVIDSFMGTKKIIRFRRGERFVMRRTELYDDRPSPPASARSRFIVGMTEDRVLRLNNRLAMTYDGDDVSLISYDGRNWLNITSIDAATIQVQDRSALREWFTFHEVSRTPNELVLDFKWANAANPQRDFYWQWNRPERPVRYMSPGMIVTSPEQREISIDLRKEVLWVDSGTTVDLDFQIVGNLMEAASYPDRFEMRVLRDFWLYTESNSSMTISFDGRDWSNFFWDFEIKNEIKTVVVNQRQAKVTAVITLRYNGPK